MAEFCLDCFNRINGTNRSADSVILEDDFCEGCGTCKPCVIGLKSPQDDYFERLKEILFPWIK